MFKFNFAVPDDPHSESSQSCDVAFTEQFPQSSDVKPSQPCVEVEISYVNHSEFATDFVAGPTIGKRCLMHLAIDSLRRSSEEFNSLEETGSDLISGSYEGGYKVWECTWDLITYLSEEHSDFSGQKVIDLGCGHGLCGIHALLSGAELVMFQDYNSGVLSSVTSRNLSANDCSLTRAMLVAGAWSELSSHLEKSGLFRAFDVVLTSETVYEKRTIPDLALAIKSCLKPGGIAYVAAKAVYFGVGGTPRDLHEALSEIGVEFTWEEVRVINAGVKRLVIKITLS